MSAAHILAALAALMLAGCAAAPRAAAPVAAAPAAPALQVTNGDGVIHVSGPAAHEDALAAHHCAAAKRARLLGAGALVWDGGVAKRDATGDGVAADLVYQISGAPGAVTSGAAPADRRAAAVGDWLIYCDEAGIPREGEA
ncbi:hypothetical protein [Pikeienuella sp. HZG-20]|uniref:hypothetical protein n=1 Tax=Paludibacillus litoralis TaxID=3133267 RepID=UPI0030EE80D3